MQKRTNGQYTESVVKDVVSVYTENGEVQCIVVNKGVDSVSYVWYYFESMRLIFAYLEAGDSHRLYFNNGRLFRRRCASNAVNFSEADNHDNEDSEEIREWEKLRWMRSITMEAYAGYKVFKNKALNKYREIRICIVRNAALR